MRLTARRRFALFAVLVAAPAAVLLAPLVAQAQEASDAEVLEIDLDNANCFGHHAAETPPFRTTVLLVPQSILEVPAGKEFDLPVQVQVAWKQEMRSLKIALNLSGAPNLAFVGEREPFADSVDGVVDYQGTFEHEFTIEDNATEAVVTLAGDEGPLNANDLDLKVFNPDGSLVFNKSKEDTSLEGMRSLLGGRQAIAHEDVRLTQAQILDGGTGAWKAQVTFPGGNPPNAGFKLNFNVYYNTSSNAENFVPVGTTLPAGAMANVTFRLRALGPGPAVLGLRSLGWAHYLHTDAQATDDGNFSKTQPFSLVVGSQLRVAAQGGPVIGIGFDPLSKLERQWGFLLGWLGFFLVGPSLLLGGTFGSASVRALNKAAGSARQRVLWHNALSYVLLVVGLLHMVLFLLEVTYSWTIGLVWGSLTLAAIIGLGVTGALQARIAKSYGYATWRFTHFLLGMLVIVGIALHVVVDGVDLQFLRDFFL